MTNYENSIQNIIDNNADALEFIQKVIYRRTNNVEISKIEAALVGSLLITIPEANGPSTLEIEVYGCYVFLKNNNWNFIKALEEITKFIMENSSVELDE